MSKKLLVKILIIEAVVGGLALLFIIVALWNRPLGPTLDLSTSAPGVSDKFPGLLPAGENESESIAATTPTPSSLISQIEQFINPPTPTIEPLCSGPAVMNLLVVGSDARGEGYLYGLADSIRIVRIDFTKPAVMALDMPRDLWVEIQGIADHYGITHAKLNQAYFFGNPGMGYYDGPGEGPGLLSRTLLLNFDIQVDHYLAMNMHTFSSLIDEIGGIDIYVASKIDLNDNQDGANPDFVFEPGVHHLAGDMALKLARDRNPSTFQRARYQNIVLTAIMDKLLTPATLPKLPKLITEFTGAVQTDLSPNEITKLLCLGQYITEDNTRMLVFPENIFSGGHVYDPYREVNTWILEGDFNQIRAYLTDFKDGNWP